MGANTTIRPKAFLRNMMKDVIKIYVLDTSTSTSTGQPIETLPSTHSRKTKGILIDKKMIDFADLGQVIVGQDKFLTRDELCENEILLHDGIYYRVIETKKPKLNGRLLAYLSRVELFRH